MHTDHAMAIDQNGVLYSWGSNISKRAGFNDDLFDGIFEPKKVPFLAIEGIKALRIESGFDHSLLQA